MNGVDYMWGPGASCTMYTLSHKNIHADYVLLVDAILNRKLKLRIHGAIVAATVGAIFAPTVAPTRLLSRRPIACCEYTWRQLRRQLLKIKRV